ncbi:hypothetical protein CEXT_259791 [Caerostris extrusa]|uniref:Uncharacterized protein n=1 Tax=Caerostris extrusa TaxID=172846 RepID=A0AAV4P3Y9_CAEEX|nr:hypothetical protein CEXT_259791 [Caerostris extrusa]
MRLLCPSFLVYMPFSMPLIQSLYVFIYFPRPLSMPHLYPTSIVYASSMPLMHDLYVFIYALIHCLCVIYAPRAWSMCPFLCPSSKVYIFLSMPSAIDYVSSMPSSIVYASSMNLIQSLYVFIYVLIHCLCPSSMFYPSLSNAPHSWSTRPFLCPSSPFYPYLVIQCPSSTVYVSFSMPLIRLYVSMCLIHVLSVLIYTSHPLSMCPYLCLSSTVYAFNIPTYY